MSTTGPIIRQAGEGEHLGFAGGGVFTMKATAAETAGAFLLMGAPHRAWEAHTPAHPPRGRGDLCARGRAPRTHRRRGASRRSGRVLPRAARRSARDARYLRNRAPARSADARDGRGLLTGTRANRPTRRRTRHGRPTGHGCARWQRSPTASNCSAPRRLPPRSRRRPPRRPNAQARDGQALSRARCCLARRVSH